MRHANPNDDVAAIFDRALTLLLAELSKSKYCATERPRHAATAVHARSRHIPIEIRREVWTRDGGRCAFRSEHGRCDERGFLEFHHVVPFADGGETTSGNLELRCQTHNQYEARLWSGDQRGLLARDTRAHFGV